MTKLPINLLLYLASTGLGGGSCWLFYTAMVEGPASVTNDQIREEFLGKIKQGRSSEADDRRDRYARNPEWWKTFRDANMLGTLPPVKEPETPTEVEEPKVDTGVPIEDILSVVSITFDSGDGHVHTGCVVKYKPEANVQPPEGLFGSGGATASSGDAVGLVDPSGAVGSSTRSDSGTRRGRSSSRRSAAPMSTASGGTDRLTHHLKINEVLWSSHDNIRLIGVADDASHVIFRREDGGKPEAEWEEVKAFKNELELPTELLEELLAGRKSTGKKTPGEKSGSPESSDAWVAVEETREVQPGQVHISRQDNDYLRTNMSRVLHEEVGIRAYRSKSGRIRGLQITRVPSQLSRFGLVNGDVILEVNGIPVSTKAQAIKVGRQQYNRGSRTFIVKVLSRGVIGERTYYAPRG